MASGSCYRSLAFYIPVHCVHPKTILAFWRPTRIEPQCLEKEISMNLMEKLASEAHTQKMGVFFSSLRRVWFQILAVSS